MKVAIQGERGSNSHMAALAMLGAPLDLIPCATSYDVFQILTANEPSEDGTAVSVGAHDIQAVLPIENSLHGAVFEHYDLLLEYPVEVVGETLLRVRHNLMVLPGTSLADLRGVRSHPVALSQCRHWLRAHPGIETLPANDTAGGARQIMALGDPAQAAIAPALAAELYGAEILKSSIEDHAENYTRFLLLRPCGARQPALTAGTEATPTAKADKVSLAFTLEHRPGTLLRALAMFAEANFNLTKIESRPVPGRPWEYVFFLDLRFTQPDRLDAALGALERETLSLHVLGRYPAAPEPERES